ncbi:MAG: glycine--tRNA ligase subunit beta [Armatimonadetes bacterium]|nr:glycine--tRNA ligase subunit beta [Armatimonadota bacterium]
MTRNFLLEIGTEELPASFLPAALSQFKSKGEEILTGMRLSYHSVTSLGTPRRLSLHVSSLAERQDDVSREVKGPARKVAYDAQGNPTKALLGFARSCGVPPETVEVRTASGAEYVFALVHEKGQPARDVMPDLVRRLIQSLTFPKTMRWGAGSLAFARPIRRLVVLFGIEPIAVALDGLLSGGESKGHPFLSQETVHLTDPDEYIEVLRRHFVLVDQEERAREVSRQIQILAREADAGIYEEEKLLTEITHLVEFPTSFVGEFPVEYLELPVPVLTTVMMKQQRYFPLIGEDGTLVPKFIGVRDGGTLNLEGVREGNERVLLARLNDARFFWKEDRRIPLEQRRSALGSIAFGKNLGSFDDKSQRLEALSERICSLLGMSEALPAVKRCAQLCKADLATQMVFEFPDLQGIMGREHALADGEPRETAEGIFEHYLPRFSGDRMPQTLCGSVVGIADRLDTLAGCFYAGMIPTGSADPYGLRRAALGLLGTILERSFSLDLVQLLNFSLSQYEGTARTKKSREGAQKDLTAFLTERLPTVLDPWQFRYDAIRTIEETALRDLPVALEQLKVLSAVRGEALFLPTVTVAVRIHNIIRDVPRPYRQVSPELFTEDEERELFSFYEERARPTQEEAGKRNFQKVWEMLHSLCGRVDHFFDKVLVMVEDEAVRENRRALLGAFSELFRLVGDLSRIALD